MARRSSAPPALPERDQLVAYLERACADEPELVATVHALARGIYEERAFDRMPILADALMDAGCDDEGILGHCRRQGSVHVRGCWDDSNNGSFRR